MGMLRLHSLSSLRIGTGGKITHQCPGGTGCSQPTAVPSPSADARPTNDATAFKGAPPFKPNPESRPAGVNGTVYSKALELIRSKSPSTLVSPYTGDICSTIDTLYTNAAPAPNSTDPRGCTPAVEGGEYFHPSEMHGITIQEGDDGNTDARPTYWFWHEWACAGNVTGCPWVGHSNASRIFYSYIQTVGHGAVLNMNIPPTSSGQMNASVVQVMAEAGQCNHRSRALHCTAPHLGPAWTCNHHVASVLSPSRASITRRVGCNVTL